MAAITICSDFGAQKNSHTVSTVSPSICHEVMGPDAMIFVFWMLSFQPAEDKYPQIRDSNRIATFCHNKYKGSNQSGYLVVAFPFLPSSQPCSLLAEAQKSYQDPLEKGMATHSRICTWKIPWTEESGRLPSTECKELDMIEWLSMHPHVYVTQGSGLRIHHRQPLLSTLKYSQESFHDTHTPSGSWENHVPGTPHCTFTQAPPLTETPPISPTPLLSGLLLELQCPSVKSPLSGSFPCPPEGWPSTMLGDPWQRSSTGLIQAWLHFVCLLLCLHSPAKSKFYDAELGLGFIHFWSSVHDAELGTSELLNRCLLKAFMYTTGLECVNKPQRNESLLVKFQVSWAKLGVGLGRGGLMLLGAHVIQSLFV